MATATSALTAQDTEFLRELGQQLRVDSIRCSTAAAAPPHPRQPRRRLRPPDVLDVARRPDRGADRAAPGLRLEPPRRSQQRPPDLLEGPRAAARVRDVH